MTDTVTLPSVSSPSVETPAANVKPSAVVAAVLDATAPKAAAVKPWGDFGPLCYLTEADAIADARRMLADSPSYARPADDGAAVPWQPAPGRWNGWPAMTAPAGVRRVARKAIAAARYYATATATPYVVLPGDKAPTVAVQGKDGWTVNGAALDRFGGAAGWLPTIAVSPAGQAIVSAAVGVSVRTLTAAVHAIVTWADAHGETGDNGKGICEDADALLDRAIAAAVASDDSTLRKVARLGKSIERAAVARHRVPVDYRPAADRKTAGRDAAADKPADSAPTGPNLL